MSQPESKKRMPFAYGFLIIFSVLFCLAAYLSIFLIDIEIAAGSGPIIGVLGLVIMGFAKKYNHPPGTRMGYTMVSFVIGLTLLIWIAGWSPSEAYIPFGVLGTGFVIAMFVLSNRSFATAPKRFQDWNCQQCGYPIYGLTTPRCPECGNAIDPAMLEKHHRRWM